MKLAGYYSGYITVILLSERVQMVCWFYDAQGMGHLQASQYDCFMTVVTPVTLHADK